VILVVEEQVVTINLIIPPSPWLISDLDLPFLGPLYLSAFLKDKGYDVVVSDLSGVDLDKWIPKQYDVYGITGTSANFPQIRDISYRINDYHLTDKIIAGGAHATLYPHHLLKYSAVDMCIQGPGEKRFLNVLKTGKSDGTVYRDGSAITMRERDPNSEDFKMASVPDYEAIDFKKYLPSQTFKYLLGEVNEATIVTTLGCPWNCAFCGQRGMRNTTKFIPLPDVEKNISILKNNYGVELFYVLDDTFGFAKSRFGDLINLFKRMEIKWHCLLRADLAQQSRLEAMKDAGCLGIVYGFESGSNKILNLMNKGTTVNQNLEAARLSHEAGLMVRAQMIVGFPGENDQTIKETKRFVKNAQVDVWGIHTFQPFPGSDVWYFPEKYGIKIDRETDFSDFHTIGKIGEKVGTKKVQKWAEELREIAGQKNIERKMS
jgi:anaerobic magnesium-protoporphyrin IX monomethyl ester cyclase